MKTSILSASLLLSLLCAAPAQATNDMILLSPDDLSNKASFDITGSGNRLVLDQTRPGAGAGNEIRVSILGDRNGGPLGAKFSGAAASVGLAPGLVLQRGFGNAVAVDIRGSDNLFALAQLGDSNVVRASITGVGNQAAIAQTGSGNFASFTQNGLGNIVSVRQTSW